MNPAPTIANRTGLPASAPGPRAGSRIVIPSPDLPGGGAPPPVLLQHLFVAQGIHRLPEPAVAVRGELAVTSQPAQRVPFPDRLVIVDILDRARLEHEESSIDPRPVAGRLLVEMVDSCLALLHRDHAQAARRVDRRPRSEGQ